MPQMYCRGCGLPTFPTEQVPDRCSFCRGEEWVTEESEITWDAIRNRSGSGEIMKQIQEEQKNRERKQQELDLQTKGLKQKFGKFFKRK